MCTTKKPEYLFVISFSDCLNVDYGPEKTDFLFRHNFYKCCRFPKIFRPGVGYRQCVKLREKSAGQKDQ